MPKIVKFIAPILILVLGVGSAKMLMSRKKTATKKPPAALIAGVEYVTVAAGAPRAQVRATGTVEGARQVSLSALVSGEVVSVAKGLVPGGKFRKGERLLRVDPRDYEIAVDQEGSRVQQARLELQLEQERGSTALREWELLSGGKDAAEAPLALRGPQLETVQRSLEAAQSGLKRAELNLERTSLRAPFNAMVLSETVEVGQLVSPGAPVATLVGTDRFRVKVAIPVEQLSHIAIPGINGTTGAPVLVTQDLGGQLLQRNGTVDQLAGQLDPQTRTAEVFVGIDNPLSGDGLPLLPGAFVTVDIEGKPVDGAIEVPRGAVVDGNVVWTVTPEDTLARNEVVIGWQNDATAFVLQGLTAGDRVVTTRPSLPVQGAKVRPQPASTNVAGDAPTTPTEG